MRLVFTSTDHDKASALSQFFKQHGIDNQLDISTNKDWGSHDYGTITCKLWIIDEERVVEAEKWIKEFELTPNDPRLKAFSKNKIVPIAAAWEEEPEKESELPPPIPKKNSIATYYILLLCSFILLVATLTSPSFVKVPASLPYTPLFSSPLYKELLFDYPRAYDLIDKLVNVYGLGELQHLQELPAEGQHILQEFYRTPYWQGFYEILVQHFQKPDTPWTIGAPLFEKIRQGEIWRLITPCFLHSDIFHLFFNMIWLLVIGKQMEERLRMPRYLLFILITGIISNTAQYLTSGPNFIGFSGVLCAMITFVWIRTKKTPWEGYQLQGSTMAFISFFILTMFGLQLISFFAELYYKTAIAPGIANTAHLSGALVGWILGYLNFFSRK